MTLDAFLFQAINGLSSASGLFFIAVGLSLIFGVTRIINIAHGSLYMMGTYIAYSFATKIGGVIGFWGGIVATAIIVGCIGALIEILLLRRIYRAPELFQLLATFALVLVFNDMTHWIWGSEDLLGPRAPGLTGSVELLGRRLPSYDLFPGAGRAGGAAGPAFHAEADAVRPPDPRGDAGPRDGRRAGRQPGGAVHVGVRARRRAGRSRRRAAGGARAGDARHRSDRASATPSWWWWSAAWARSPAPIWPP